jgi:hypothetical protein
VGDHALEHGGSEAVKLRPRVEEGEHLLVTVEHVGVARTRRRRDRTGTRAVAVADAVEHADAVGEHQDGIGDGDVLVVPVGEAEPGVQQERPVIHLVPDDVEQPERLRPVAQHERPRTAESAEHVGAADQGLGAAADAGVPEEQHLVSGPAEAVGDCAQRSPRKPVVAVDERDVATTGEGEPGRAGAGERRHTGHRRASMRHVRYPQMLGWA